MEHIKAHITQATKKKDRSTERGELMSYFMERLNRNRVRDGYPPLTLPRMGRVLQAIPTKDLYYLKSVCDQATDFSKKFWWEVSPKNHLPKKHQEKKEEKVKTSTKKKIK